MIRSNFDYKYINTFAEEAVIPHLLQSSQRYVILPFLYICKLSCQVIQTTMLPTKPRKLVFLPKPNQNLDRPTKCVAGTLQKLCCFGKGNICVSIQEDEETSKDAADLRCCSLYELARRNKMAAQLHAQRNVKLILPIHL